MQDESFKTTSCQTKQLPFLDVINSIPLYAEVTLSQLLDFSKAFDSVPQLWWLKGKLEKMEISQQTVKQWGTALREEYKLCWTVLFWDENTQYLGVPQVPVLGLSIFLLTV